MVEQRLDAVWAALRGGYVDEMAAATALGGSSGLVCYFRNAQCFAEQADPCTFFGP